MTDQTETTTPAGLGRTDGGSLTVDRNALVERWVETFGLDLASPIEGALVVQEVGHVAGLVDAAVAAERQRIVETLRAAAAGRREYAPNAASLGAKAIGYSELLEIEAGTIDAAARVVEGDLQPLYGWLPSWRWSDEMVARLYPDKSPEPQKPQDPPSEGAYMESHQPHPENGRTAATAGGNRYPCRNPEPSNP